MKNKTFLSRMVHRLHRDDRGEIPVGPMLIIGLIIIPLVILLVNFRDELGEWLSKQFDRITGADTDVKW